ncbi:ATP-dependent helicase [Borrelia miyamotoi]|uniref:DNA 3'-5' helicase n=1 Tax=Borrelia miyamotoi TaxID=47466 RepID=A0AAX3JML9_9SPIR|nr:ATP-dependent helicase [Borrelia miyamotoi]QFP41983.1 ATP-dependent helicase [Borrelia miyamotoi]QFP48099.1 ATP-dependent helicase [Borrelia miyamotoi]QGT55859.1 AAA family ATPase [Borrelia miyamotoi]QGT56638.1 AAA family ATPase [Borrelia miyamotoi]WAZ71899.1 ATP-dependent helicase [Borrelia miyamotoi]
MDKIEKFLFSLNSYQKKIVLDNTKNPILVLAGPGSGKTRVITAKIAHLIKKMKLRPEEILALTFTNKAASEMTLRINYLFDFDKALHIQTFHSFGAWLLRLYFKEFDKNYDSNFTIWDTNDVVRFVKQIGLASTIELAKHVSSLILKCKENYFLDDYYGLDEKSYKDIELYEQEKSRNNAFDFADLILKVTLMLRNCEDIKVKVHKRFKAIFVDEYQDTSYAQFLFLKELYCKDMHHFMVVGDEDQSIYSFRGARIENILEFEKTFDDVSKYYLVQNYRSSLSIVNVANDVISKNSNRYDKVIITENKMGKRIKFFVFQNPTDEAEYFSNFLLEDKLETAVLYRFNYQSLQFEKAFLKHNIPHKVLGSIRFYERGEIKDIISLLRLFVNKKDRVSFLRVINKPARGIGKTTTDKIVGMINDRDVNLDLILASRKIVSILKGKARDSLVAFLSVYDELWERLQREFYVNLSSFIKDVVIKFGFWDYYQKFDKDDKSKNIDELISSGVEYSGSFEGLVIFLENSSLAPLIHGDSKSSVILSSIHGVKGLEFDRVIISGLEKGLLPAEIEKLTQDRLEEERRLFYVAITRAKFELFVTINLQRFFAGILRSTAISVFFQDISKDNYDIVFVPEYLKDNFKYFFSKNGSKSFNIGDYINYNGENGIVLDKWYKNNEQFIKISLSDGKKAVLSSKYMKKLYKI